MSSNRVFSLCLLLVAGLASAQTTIPFKPVKAGASSKATNPSEAVIRTADAFNAYWTKNFGNTNPPKGIDWTNSELIVIHLGHRGSRAYAAVVNSVVKDGDETIVNWTERIPAAKTLQRVQPASPYVIVSIPATQSEVVFHGQVAEPGKPYSDGNAFPILKLVSGGHSLVKEEASEVVDDAATLNTLWQNAFGRSSSQPATDFSKFRYVAIFLGQRPTPGYEVVIQRIARIGPKEVKVIYSETKPAKDAIEPQMITNPFVILKLPRTDDAVTIERGT